MKFAKETINEVLLWRMDDPSPEPAYFAEETSGGFRAVPPAEARRNNASWAAGLLRRGYEVGTRIAVLSGVRAEWVECDCGNLLGRLVTVGIYPTCTPEQVAYILQHSEAKVLVLGDQGDLDHCAPALASCPNVELIVGMSPLTAPEGMTTPIVDLEVIRSEGDAALAQGDTWLREHASAAEPDDLITLVYTSGTTGPPKGAELTHRNLFHVTDSVAEIIGFEPHWVGLVFLPLAHILQRYAVYQGLRFGGTGYYTSRMTELGDILPVTRPHVLAVVPRVLEKIHARALARVETMPPAKQAGFARAFSVATRVRAAERRGERIGLVDRFRMWLYDRLVFKTIREKLGGNLELIVSGGAPLAVELSEWFDAAGLLVVEGYGLTETSAPATTGTPDAYRFGSVGRPIPGTDVRIAEDGEIEVRGPGVFRSYFKNPEATAAAFTEDGFFRTGDIGTLDPDGFLTITDRKKDLIITAAGKNIAPAGIENLLKQHRLIGQAMVHGDRRKFLSCLLTLDEEEAPLWAAEQGHDDTSLAAIAARADVQAQIDTWMADCNAQLANYERPKKWRLLSVAFTPESGYLTPTLKLKRREITKDFGADLDAFYASDG
ncbi:MAG: long-chain fatty acid--CoA ligase [Deltaproteobacteria bacterium]|nr:long-chain fatty acid--CoA ligase [Deltaproteobacteria bacterium]